MGEMVVDALYNGFKKDSSIFSKRPHTETDLQRSGSSRKTVYGRQFKDEISAERWQFKTDYYMELKDFHKTAVHR